jgi:hypothetical protein
MGVGLNKDAKHREAEAYLSDIHIAWVRQARRENHEFIRHYGTTNMCDSCSANHMHKKGEIELNWGNFTESAGWRTTRCRQHDYIAYTPVHRLSPWMAIPGWSIENTWFDLMHNLPHGVGKDLAGSVLCEIAEVSRNN